MSTTDIAENLTLAPHFEADQPLFVHGQAMRGDYRPRACLRRGAAPFDPRQAGAPCCPARWQHRYEKFFPGADLPSLQWLTSKRC